MSNDSVGKTLTVALSLCIVCSVLVAGAAVGLRPLQQENKRLDIRKNLLLASGLLENPSATKAQIDETFKRVNTRLIDLETGEEVTDMSAEEFDQRKAAKDAKLGKTIDSDKDKAGIKRRSKYAKVYEVMDGEQVSMIVLPVHGKGLWSTMYGFVALSPDASTIKGLGFYEHGETPGLGGEIENERWQESWEGKKIYGEDLEPKIQVIKGSVSSSTPDSVYKIDGLSGATITANGVTGMMRYWLSEDGFGDYLAKMRDSQNKDENTTSEEEEVTL